MSQITENLKPTTKLGDSKMHQGLNSQRYPPHSAPKSSSESIQMEHKKVNAGYSTQSTLIQSTICSTTIVSSSALIRKKRFASMVTITPPRSETLSSSLKSVQTRNVGSRELGADADQTEKS